MRSAIAAAERELGVSLHVAGRTALGESGSTFLVRSPSGELVLKLRGTGPDALANQRRLVRLVDRLRALGYPSPPFRAVGEADGAVFTLQEVAAGEPASERDAAALVAGVLAAIELQRDQGDLALPPWPEWLLETIDVGGDGYCLHATLRAEPETSRLLDRLIALTAERRGEPVRHRDLVHFDLNPANLLQLDGTLTAIVDWNVPFTGAAQGDRGFDLATLLFYLYDVGDEVRELLRERCRAVSGEAWTSIYLAHLILRQVEWSLRHSPGSARAAYHLDLAGRVLRAVS